MDKGDKRRVLELLAVVYDLHGKVLTEMACELWMEALEGCDASAVASAFRSHAKDPDAGRFLPKPADILGRMQTRVEDDALASWLTVLRAAQAGAATCNLSEPGQMALEALGGIMAVRHADESANGFLQRRYAEAFVGFSRRVEIERLSMNSVERLQ